MPTVKRKVGISKNQKSRRSIIHPLGTPYFFGFLISVKKAIHGKKLHQLLWYDLNQGSVK